MVLLTPTLDLETSTLNLTIPSTSSAASSTHTIPFAAPPSAPHHTTFGIWGSRFDGYEVGDSALLSALSAFFGKPVLLVLKGHENRPAAVVAEWRESEGVTGLYGREMEPPMTRWSDKAPILLVCEESRKDVGERIELRERGSGGRWEGRGASLEMERWRGNVVMEGAEEPWEEDGWEDLRFGSGEGDTFEWLVSSRCSRCMVGLLSSHQAKSLNFKMTTPSSPTSTRRLESATKSSQVRIVVPTLSGLRLAHANPSAQTKSYAHFESFNGR